MGEIDLEPTCSFGAIELDDEEIKIRRWEPSSASSSCALLVHGLGAHSGWFEAMGRRLSQHGVLAVSYDHCGFGTRKHLPLRSYSQWVKELCQVYRQLQQMNGQPVFLMANSMGALLSIAAMNVDPSLFFGAGRSQSSSGVMTPLAGLAMFSPGFDGYPATFTLSYRLRAIFSALIQPKALVGLPYGPETISRDKYVQNWIANDPDHLPSVPGSMLLELLKLSKKVESVFPLRIDAPVLMLTAGVERIVNNRVNKKVFDKMVAPNKQWKQFDDAFHDLMFDTELDKIAQEVLQWQRSCVPGI